MKKQVLLEALEHIDDDADIYVSYVDPETLNSIQNQGEGEQDHILKEHFKPSPPIFDDTGATGKAFEPKLVFHTRTSKEENTSMNLCLQVCFKQENQ